MPDTVHIKGLSELETFLDALPEKLAKNVVRGGLRAGMKVVLPAAQQNVNSVSGELAKGLKIGTRSSGLMVFATIRATGPHGSIAHLVEFGTKAHFIRAKIDWMSFSGIFRKLVAHPGARPHPFLRPALDSQAQNAVIATANYMKQRLAAKEGLDVADVVIGDDYL